MPARTGFKEITDACPEGIKLHSHVAEVTSLRSVESAFELQTSSVAVNQNIGNLPFHWILVCTGHPRHKLHEEDRALGEFANGNPSLQYIDFVYPVSEKLTSIRSASNVAIKGLGLTFIDTVLALTEGRGGMFTTSQKGGLRYVFSGREPSVMFPFSRSGLPMIPRDVTYGLPRHHLSFFRASNLPRGRPVDFDRHIWPLLHRDMLFAYYNIVFQNHGLKLGSDCDADRLADEIAQFHTDYPGTDRFDPIELFQAFDVQDNLHGHTLDFLHRVTAGAEQGEHKSPLIAAAAVWRHATPFFSKIYRFGGLTAVSQRSFHTTYAGHFNRLAFGPPVVNLQKMIAVAEAGLLDFSFARNPKLKLDTTTGKFILQQGGSSKLAQACEVFIDARIPKTSLKKDASLFYCHLLETGEIREFSNDGFEPGSVDIDLAGNAIGKNGCSNERLTFYGTPTEGVTWDNDTLSRSHNDFASGWAKRVVRTIAQNH